MTVQSTRLVAAFPVSNNQMAAAIPFVIPVPPNAAVLLPAGHLGISYDVFTRRVEDNLPNGWHSHRSKQPMTYEEIF